MSFLLVAGLSKSYTVADRRLEILRELGLSVERGEMVAVMGASGVGKSTLLHLLGGLDRPDTGSIAVGEHHVTTMADRDLVALPRTAVLLLWSAAYLRGDLLVHCNRRFERMLGFEPGTAAGLRLAAEGVLSC